MIRNQHRLPPVLARPASHPDVEPVLIAHPRSPPRTSAGGHPRAKSRLQQANSFHPLQGPACWLGAGEQGAAWRTHGGSKHFQLGVLEGQCH